jgi:hypothetical protein
MWTVPQRLRAVSAAGATAPLTAGPHAPAARRHVPHAAPATRSKRAGVVLGLLHGSAGSAAVLALLPLAQFGAGPASALYLACFSLGVAAGAVAFASLFTKFAARAAAAGKTVGTCFQALIGAFAMLSGALLIFGLSVGHGGG